MPSGVMLHKFEKASFDMHIPFILFFWVYLHVVIAQTPAYLHYGVMDGLPGNQVYCGLQDSRGLLWFGTDKGLAQFDGSRFRIYSMADGLPDLEVLNIKEDSKGRLWLFCFRMKSCYLYQGRIFTEKEDSLLAKIDFIGGMYNISEDTDGNIWHFKPSNDAYCLKKDQIISYRFPRGAAGLQMIGDDCLLFGTYSIMKFSPDRQIEIVYDKQRNIDLPSISVSGNRILYSYSDRLLLLEWKNDKINKIAELPDLSGQTYTDMLGRFWICSPSIGAVCFDNLHRELKNAVTYLAGKKVTTMFEDSQGTLWFCTADEGIWALRKNAPVTYRKEFLPSNNIRSIASNQSGNILVGDDIGNVHIINGNKIRTVSYGSVDGYNLIRQILSLEDGGFWAASDEALLSCSKNYSVTNKHEIRNSLKSIAIQENRVWLASSSSLGYIDEYNNSSFKKVIHSRFTSVCVDSENNVWAGNMHGLYSQIDSFQLNWGERFRVLKSRITTVCRRDKNRLWIVTPENGLISATVNSGLITEVEVINMRLKQKIMNIQSLYTQPDGSVWLATNRGVYGIGPDYQVRHINRHDGLGDDDVNAVLVQNDTLWAGTVGGLTCMTLQARDARGDFATYLTTLRFQKDNQPFELHLLDTFSNNREIILPSNATNIELDIAGLDYRSYGDLSYEVMQSELLLPWQWWTFDNISTWSKSNFTNIKKYFIVDLPVYNLGNYLPPGRYQFKVTALKAPDIRSQYPDTWTIMKLPYWHETIWFYLSILGIIFFAVFRIYKVRKGFRETQVAASMFQLQALHAQMNPHFIGNTINAIQQFLHPPDPIKASEYISLFMRLLNNTMTFSERTIITFDEELAYDQKYLELVRLRHENRFRYEINGSLQVPPETPVPSMIIQPILENATIHGLAPEGMSVIKLEFFCENSQCLFTLTDNGIGINEMKRRKKLATIQRESKGLEMLQKKIKTLNKLYDLELRLEVEDLSERLSDQKGTCVKISYNLNKIWQVTKLSSHPKLT